MDVKIMNISYRYNEDNSVREASARFDADTDSFDDLSGRVTLSGKEYDGVKSLETTISDKLTQLTNTQDTSTSETK